MKKKFFSTNSLFTRLFIYFLTIMIPIEITGIIMFTWGQNQVQREIEDAAFSQLTFLRERFEDEIFNVSAQLDRLNSLVNFNSFSLKYNSMSNSEFYLTLREQQSFLRLLPEDYAILEDVIIYYQGLSKALSANRGYLPISEDSFERINLGIRQQVSPIKTVGKKLYIGMMYPIDSLYKSSNPRYIITMYLSTNFIQNYLSKYSGNYNTVIYNHSSKNALFEANTDSKQLTIKQYNDYFKKIESLNFTDTFTHTSIQDKKYYIIAEYSPDLNCSFIQFVPLSDIMHVPRQYNRYLIAFTIFTVLVMIFYSFIAHRVVSRPVNQLLNAFHKLESGNFDFHLDIKRAANEFELLSAGFNKMAKRLEKTIDQLYKQEIYSQRMELKQLQMQINPHFLYNSYFVLHRLVMQEDMENAKLLSSYLGKYFQYITRNGLDRVPLQKEWDHARNYMEIQSIRYSIRIEVAIGILPSKYENIYVPRLILQPILENAFEHGLHEKLENGLVTLHFIDDLEYIIIQISDNGEELTESDMKQIESSLKGTEELHKETTALINIHRRLKLEFGPRSGLSISRNHPSGFIVQLKIDKSATELINYEKEDIHEII